MSETLLPLSIVLAAALLAAVVAALTRRLVRPPGPAMPLDHLGEPRTFAFRDGYLVSAEHGTRFLLPQPIDRLAAWRDLRAALASLVPEAGAAMDALRDAGTPFLVDGPLGADRLHVLGVRDGAELRVTVSSCEIDGAALRVDAAALAALEAEASLLGGAMAAAPVLAWALDLEGRVVWANDRYTAEAARTLGAEAAARWPLPVLFPEGEAGIAPMARRVLRDPGGEERSFEITAGPRGGGLRHLYAQPLARIVEVETSLRRFIDTLTRSFAHLPTGLAIFDAERRLVMFNPPILDLTGLDGAWLAAKPILTEVLDAMRERKRLPEPRDWRAWRGALLAAGTEAAQDPWQETWSLPGGQTLRMTVRPQRDGAVALLLEDATAEMAEARRRRSDEEVLCALLDASRAAVAAFGPDGEALHLNGAMRALMGIGPDRAPALGPTLLALSELFRPSPAWGDIRDVVRDPGPAADWSETLRLAEGATDGAAAGSAIGDAGGDGDVDGTGRDDEVALQVLALGGGRVALRLEGEALPAPAVPAGGLAAAAAGLARLGAGHPPGTPAALRSLAG